LTRPCCSAALGIDEIAGEQHLERLLATEVARQADPGVAQNRPTLIPEVAKRALSAATARSHIETSWQPAAVAMPCTRAITGCGICVRVIIILPQRRNRSCMKALW
jgi:hypothetical protein